MNNLTRLLAVISVLTIMQSFCPNFVRYAQSSVFSEDFEDNNLDSRVQITSVGNFTDAPGIKDTSILSGQKAFGFGRTSCPSNCFAANETRFTLTFPSPQYVSTLSFKEIELYGNWGSTGLITIDGVLQSEKCSIYTQSFGRCPHNDSTPDQNYRTRLIDINRVVQNIQLKVTDITRESEIFIDDIMISYSPIFSLSFPLRGYTSISAPIASAFDHSMASSYAKNSMVTAYTGEAGNQNTLSENCDCYNKVDGLPFIINGNYTGASSCGGASYLCYDGHPGTDYPISSGTPLYATADGIAHLPVSFPGTGAAQNYNTVEIDHQNGYKTYYLHLSRQNVTEGQQVYRGQTIIGYSGDMGSPGSFHLHLEIQKDGVPVDPYGWQGSGSDPYILASNLNLWGDQNGETSSLVFSSIGPQSVNSPFNLTVTAKDSSGNVDNSFNGEVSIASSNVGPVLPGRVRLVSGSATFPITLYNPGTTTLFGQGGDLRGSSESFTVSGGGNCHADISGRVIDLNNDIIVDARVDLYDMNNSLLATQYTDSNGKYRFVSKECNSYKLKFTKDAEEKEGSNATIFSNNQCAFLETKIAINSGTNGTPVILIPGILGSSQGYSRYPILGEPQDKGKLTIHDPGHSTGFRNLEDDLKDISNGGYNVFTCPWDWRLSPKKAAEEYLKPKIEEALKKSTTGKVHIVAHSMGGLVVRALIQESQEWADKIDRFAMVGTPNLGSANAYYIWEGGDPKLVDDITNIGIFDPAPNFYSKSIKNLWEKTYNGKNWDDTRHKFIKQFVQEKGKSVKDLMFYGDFLYNNSSGNRSVSRENENETLREFNSDVRRFRMSPDGANNTIETGLFVGKNIETIRFVNVGPPWDKTWQVQDLWPDGMPTDNPKKTVIKGNGDGTVPYESAVWPAENGWANLINDSSPGRHVGLVKDYIVEIRNFLRYGAAQNVVEPSLSVLKSSDIVLASGVDSEEDQLNDLIVSSYGTIRIDVTDPLGNHTGVNPENGEMTENISSSSAQFEMDNGGVKISNPIDGMYHVTILGSEDRDFHIDFGYSLGEINEEKSVWGYYGNNTISFDMVINRSSTPHLLIVPLVRAPLEVQADLNIIDATTVIKWQMSTEEGITGYNIYSAEAKAPYFSKVATVVGNDVITFQTVDQWAGDNTIEAKTYTVTAVKNDGKESFFSDRVQNDDQDHDFLLDVEETEYGTDKRKKDTDDDTFSDFTEINAGSDPLTKSSIPRSSFKSLEDTIRYLQVVSGMQPSGILAEVDDINGDGRVGMEEIIYILKKLTE